MSNLWELMGPPGRRLPVFEKLARGESIVPFVPPLPPGPPPRRFPMPQTGPDYTKMSKEELRAELAKVLAKMPTASGRLLQGLRDIAQMLTRLIEKRGGAGCPPGYAKMRGDKECRLTG